MSECYYCGWPEKDHAFLKLDDAKTKEFLDKRPGSRVRKEHRMVPLSKCFEFSAGDPKKQTNHQSKKSPGFDPDAHQETEKYLDELDGPKESDL